MKNLSQRPFGRNRPGLPKDRPDLFEWARERALLSHPHISKLQRLSGVSVYTAAVLAELAFGTRKEPWNV